MKRVFETVLLLAILGLIGQFIVKGLKKGHHTSYEISNDNIIFQVSETFHDDIYSLEIKNGNERFVFPVNNYFNKNKKIVKNIYYVNEGSVSCIYPVLEDSVTSNILCYKDGINYSYNSMKNNLLVSDFSSRLRSIGVLNNFKNSSDLKNVGDIKVYSENILEGTYIYVWNYNGFYYLSKNKYNTIKIFDSDTYKNSLGILYNKYYVVPDYSQKYEFDTLYVYDMTDNNYKRIVFDEKISYDSYYNGIVDDKIYLFDKSHMIQYEIAAKKRKYSVVGNKELNALYYDNGKWETRNIYDFNKKDLKFSNVEVPNAISNVSNFYYDNGLYYYIDNNNLYCYDSIYNMKILLLNNVVLSGLQISHANIYFLKDDVLYQYNYDKGMLPLVKYNEFRYNKSNMYAVYEK